MEYCKTIILPDIAERPAREWTKPQILHDVAQLAGNSGQLAEKSETELFDMFIMRSKWQYTNTTETMYSLDVRAICEYFGVDIKEIKTHSEPGGMNVALFQLRRGE